MNGEEILQEIESEVAGEELDVTWEEGYYRLHREEEEAADGQLVTIALSGTIFDFHANSEDLNDELKQLVAAELEARDMLYCDVGTSLTGIRAYPGASAKEVAILETKAAPRDGNVEVLQSEYAITSFEDPNTKLSTSGIVTCKGILAYDGEVGVGGLAHVFEGTGEEEANALLQQLEAQDGESFLVGLTDTVGQHLRRYLQTEKEEVNRMIELPHEFTFDTETGELSPYESSEDPTLADREKKYDICCEYGITSCFQVYGPEQ